MYISKMKILSGAQLSQAFPYLSDFHAAAYVDLVKLNDLLDNTTQLRCRIMCHLMSRIMYKNFECGTAQLS